MNLGAENDCTFVFVFTTYARLSKPLHCSAHPQVEAEVSRLEQLRSRKLRHLVMKKRLELDEICRRAHMIAAEHGATEFSTEAIESGRTIYILY